MSFAALRSNHAALQGSRSTFGQPGFTASWQRPLPCGLQEEDNKMTNLFMHGTHNSPEVHEHQVQRAAQPQLLAVERLVLEGHEQRHAAKCAALVLRGPR